MPKVLLTQLPHPSNTNRNIPLAAGYLKSAAYKYGLLERADIEILDPAIADHSGCQMLIDVILSKRPEILGFSLYLWNVERTLYIIDNIKSILPDVTVVVGGPEVTRESIYILSNRNIDIFVIGEGEITFIEIIESILTGKPKLDDIKGICYQKDGKIIANSPRENIADLESIPSPYLLGFIDPRRYREIMLFTMKGCILGCTYCSWTSRGKLRPCSMDRLRDELILAKNIGDNVIVSLIDSAFNNSPIFVDFCKMVQEINKDKTLKFRCFVQADLIDEASARLLKESNFIGVEVGLQSTNPEVLKGINRSMDIDRFLIGVRNLEREGVPVTVDLIIGLPEDSVTTFENTMKYISDNNLNPILFNLSLGHGAKLSRHADKFGAQIQKSPPFYVLETDTLSNTNLRMLLNRYRDRSADFDRVYNLNYPTAQGNLANLHSSTSAPPNSLSFDDINYPVRNLILKMDAAPKSSDVGTLAGAISHKVGNNLSVLLLGSSENLQKSKHIIGTLLAQISKENPHITWDILVEAQDQQISPLFAEEISSFIHKPRIFLDHRDELFPKDLSCVRRNSINAFMLLPYSSNCQFPLESSNYIPIAKIDDLANNRSLIQQLLQGRGSGLLIESTKVSNSIMDALRLIFEENKSKKDVFFKDSVLQRLWEQEFLKVTPEVQAPHYELVIDQDLNLFWKFFDENDLLWDAVSKWNFVKQEYINDDINEIIINKIASKLLEANANNIGEVL